MAPLWLEGLLRWSDMSGLWQERKEGGRRVTRRKVRVNEQKSARERDLFRSCNRYEGARREGGREGACMYIDACNSGTAWDMAIQTAPRCVPTVMTVLVCDSKWSVFLDLV